MIVPARGKVLVEVYSQKHSFLELPETMAKPKLSVAEIITTGSNGLIKGQLVLIPTRAGLIITVDGIKLRLINELDITAIIVEEIVDGSVFRKS